MTNASILSMLAHATPTPTSRSKGQKSKSRGGGILWRTPSRTACYYYYYYHHYYYLYCINLLDSLVRQELSGNQQELQELSYVLCMFLPHDAMHKRCLCRSAVSVCPSRSCVVSKHLGHSCYRM